MEKGRRLLHVSTLALLAAFVLATGVGSGVLAAPGAKAPPLDALRIDAAARLKTPEMPPAVFRHDKHTEALAAQGKDCTVCHETPQTGRAFVFRQAGEKASAGQLEQLYHDGCIGCHAELEKQGLKTGPQDGQCRLCHDAKARYTGGDGAAGPRMSKALHALHADSKTIPGVDSFAVPTEERQNCGACHHVWDPELKKLVWAPGREDNCAACHTAEAVENRPALKDAVHAKCVGCHADMALKARAEAGPAATEDTVRSRKLGKKERKEHPVILPAIQLGTGPETCAACHRPGALDKPAEGPLPRLMRGQPDATVLLPVSNPGLTPPPGSPAASMQPVLFNHKAHELVTDSCRACHHVRIENCTVCHTVQGSKDGNFVQLNTAMHDPDSSRSCIGCHRKRVMAQRDCAGCHGDIRPMADKNTCAACHREVKGLPLSAVADGLAFQLDGEALARIAQENLARRSEPVQALPGTEVPETVTIGTLSERFEPSVMPHRKIYEALQKGIGDDALAGAFHTTPTATCAACHHNSPADGLRHPPKCSSCHNAQADKKPVQDNVPSLKAAYHQQCMACHERMAIKPAPTDCAACHAERKTAER